MYNANIYRYGKLENLIKAINYWKNKINNNPLNVDYKHVKHLEQLNIIYNERVK
jgi:hypothetical protein